METDNNKLVEQSGSKAISAPSSKASESSLAVGRSLVLAGSIMGKDIEPEEVSFWKEALQGFSAAKIEQAFKKHLLTSTYFPKPAEILELIEEASYLEGPTLVEKVRKQIEEV